MSEIDYGIVAKNLKRLMKKRSMSNDRLSELSGCGTTSIAGYKSGKSYPTSKALQKMSKALRVEVGEFFIKLDEEYYIDD